MEKIYKCLGYHQKVHAKSSKSAQIEEKHKILLKIQDVSGFWRILRFPITTLDIESSDEHPMGAHRKSLQKPSQGSSGTPRNRIKTLGAAARTPNHVHQHRGFRDFRGQDTPESIRSGGRTLIWKVAPGGAKKGFDPL